MCCLERSFKLLNHRAPMQFLLLTNMTGWAGEYTVLATSPVVTLGWLNEPLWGHLALTGTPGYGALPRMRLRAPASLACAAHASVTPLVSFLT